MLPSRLDIDHGPSSVRDAVPATGSEGFEASTYDTALRRYLEQQGS